MDDVQAPVMIDIEYIDITTKHSLLSDKHFDKDLDELTLILKSHLLIEELLRDFCQSSVDKPNYLRDARLTFKQTLNLARSFSALSLPQLEWTWGAVNSLNTMRNLMAHAIEPDEKKYADAKEVIIRAVMSHAAVSDIPTFQGAVRYLHSAFKIQLQTYLVSKASGSLAHMPIPATPSTTSDV